MREDIVDKVLKRDLPALYNIRNPLELERIFLYLCNVSSEIVSYDSIAKDWMVYHALLWKIMSATWKVLI